MTETTVTKKTAILVDPGMPFSLAPVLNDISIPLLPVGTKPLVQHWIERLAAAGFESIMVLVAHHTEKTRAFLGSGSRWGVEVQCQLYRPEQNAAAHWPLVAHLDPEGLLVLDLTVWPEADLSNWLAEQVLVKNGFLSADKGCEWLDSMRSDQSIDWLDRKVNWLPAEMLYPVTRIKELWQLNMQLVSGELVDPLPFGFEAEPGFWAGSNARIESTSHVLGAAILGESCIIGKRAMLGPNAVIGEKSVIEEGAQVQNSLVFPRSFIGSHIALSKMVVAGDMIYRIEDDVLLYINDPEIVADREQIGQRVSLTQRALSVALLVLLLVPVVLTALWLKLTGKQAFLAEQHFMEIGRSLEGRRELKGITLPTLNVQHPVWRKIPWLLLSARGRLLLVGTSLRQSQEMRYPGWVTDSELFEPGVITLADATGVKTDDVETTIITDAYQLSLGQVGANLSVILQWLIRLVR